MAKPITVRFYDVGKVSPEGPTLRTTLSAIFGLGEPGVRERQLTGGIVCRLERLSVTPGYLAGELTRVRDSDFPSAVHPDGTKSLGLEVPIGEGIAFQFREADHKLAIQYDPRVLSPGRFNDYMANVNGAAQYTFEPALDADALARFRAQPLRKLRVKLARPEQLAAVDDSMMAAGTAFRTLGNAYNAPVVTLEMSMGHFGGQLSEGAKQMVEGFLTLSGLSDDVRGIHVTPDAGEGVQNEDINLIDTLLSVRGEIVLPDEEPDSSYGLRSQFVRDRLDQHG